MLDDFLHNFFPELETIRIIILPPKPLLPVGNNISVRHLRNLC